MLENKKILIGVCGGIAAYKIATLVRLLIKKNAIVKVIMTESAKDFITPLTLATLSKNAVESKFFNSENGVWTNHVDLGLWADAYLIAPATANELAKMASGISENLLTATYLSARCKVFFCPAMDLDMYQHPAVKSNIEKLISYGNKLIPAENGELASGLFGEGRMAEPETITNYLETYFNPKNSNLKNKKILLTAGPTQESIDPVRYISNHSTGKMGIAIANELKERGAEVIFISGAISEPILKTLKVINIEKNITAEEMYEVSKKYFSQIDIAIFTAAVADYSPKEISNEKIKKNEDEFTISFKKNKDIALEFGKIKTKNQLSIGFALETNNEILNAKSKLEKKNFDMIILNSMKNENATFGYDTNKVSVINKNLEEIHFDLKSKKEVANDIVNEIEKLLL
ncbi:MAG: bifunctional phosphopantothenoylcysteine decarboxylase/phosphopantothenate--cysteine ligase CoaBC [Cytophagales bacterium]|nr:MAG: bifunctional phosphopantothenoylcysteine decarboxylase/phosphopantothenate--cysteine ligase CoaBC [Cytophagales bacterium]